MSASPAELLRRYGLSARKSWGQNFLHAPHVHAAITEAAYDDTPERIIEIGCGLGSLTEHLLAGGAQVCGIERDRDLCHVLREEYGSVANFRLFEDDAVRFDYAQAQAEGVRPTIVGNLPYHLTGPLLFALLARHQATASWVVMVQKEVADRLCAEPGNKRYGGITVGLGRVRHIDRVCLASRGCFTPPPRVDSAVVRLRPRAQPTGEVQDQAAFLELVRGCFMKRRKTLQNALTTVTDRDTARRWCEQAEVDPSVRPERLTSAQFAALARAREAERDANA